MSDLNDSYGIALNSQTKLLHWINNNGWAGYDPYDIKSLKWVLRISKRAVNSKFFSVVREIVYELFYTFPVLSRKIFRVKKRVNAKAIGLLATSYLDIYKQTNNKAYKKKAEECLQWLIENNNAEKGQLGWGYPFKWQSANLIPESTPNGIVTTAAGEAFWNFYDETNDSKYLDYCIEICEFLSNLPIERISENSICFSYTPVYINHVHNLNLFVAEFLLKVGLETNNLAWIKVANEAINYTINDQLPDGSFDYNGPPEKHVNFIDNYHTGFVIRMLYSIWKLTDRADVFNSLDKCYKHYVSNFFERNGAPKLQPNRMYRLDIHSASESINCLTSIIKDFPEAKQLINKIISWTINELQDSSGYFYYGIIMSRFLSTPLKSKIAYFRWGQAWMLRALSNYLLTFARNK